MARNRQFSMTAPRGAARVWMRGLAITGIVAVVFTLAWALLLGLLWGYAWLRLGGVDLRALDGDTPQLGTIGAVAPAGATTVLVTMTEPRDPTRPRDPALAAPVALVQIGGPRDEAPAVLLLPIELEAHVDGVGPMTLADIQVERGADTLLQAVIDYTGVRIDHVVALTVDALPQLVEIVGGVEVCLPDQGCRETSAAQVWASQRGDDPVVVARTVAATVDAVATALRATSVVRSPFAARRAIEVVATEFETDISLRGRELLHAAQALADLPALTVDVVPVVRNPATGNIVPLDEPAAERFQHLQQGTPFDAGDPQEEIDRLLLRGLRIAVLNGAGIEGLAAHVQAQLQEAGVRTVGTGNAPVFDRLRTLVTYDASDSRTETAALRLAELIEPWDVEPAEQPLTFEGDEVDILVIAGASSADRNP